MLERQHTGAHSFEFIIVAFTLDWNTNGDLHPYPSNPIPVEAFGNKLTRVKLKPKKDKKII